MPDLKLANSRTAMACYSLGASWTRRIVRAIGALFLWIGRPRITSVLAVVNEGRSALALTPLTQMPVGDGSRFSSDPLSIALGGTVGVDGIHIADASAAEALAERWDTSVRSVSAGGAVVELPPTLRHFVRDFDLGAYPSLARRQG